MRADASRHLDNPSTSFNTTHWSAVLQAGGNDPTAAKAALTQLCRAYWFPLYAYARRRGHNPEDAQDLTQEFFARLIEKDWLTDIKPHGGRFRSFLLTAFNRLLANEYDRRTAAKRGGGQSVVSLNQADAEQRYACEPITSETPEKAFERRWALAMLDQALSRLGEEARVAGKVQHFEILSPFLSREPSPGDYDAAAARLKMSSGAVAAAVYRLRQRYREVLRASVADTVAASAEVDDELRHLLAALCQ
jgi:RNA polymerase sigma-70 factor (ECF subfamily)